MVEGGGQLCRCPALTTADGKYLVVAVSDCVRLYGVASGTVAAVLRGHTAAITAAVLNARNDAQIYTASLDGTILLWDYADGEVAKRYDVGVPITQMVIPARGKYAVLTLNTGGKTCRIRHFNLAAGTLYETAERIDGSPPLTVSQSGKLVATFIRHTTCTWCPQQPRHPMLRIHATKMITCVAIDRDGRVATGDAAGRIRVYGSVSAAAGVPAQPPKAGQQSLADPAKVADSAGGGVIGGGGPTEGLPCTTWHWHAHAVLSLCFSSDGIYLLSGGEEAVLVFWVVATGERSYLPRLGAPITSISACRHDAAKFVICQADNTLRMVNMATRQLELSILGLQPSPKSHLHSPSVALLLPSSAELVLGAPNACLQFYNLLQDKHLDRLQVAPRNMVSLTEDDRTASKGPYAAPPEPHVQYAASSSDGSVLVTLHASPDASPHGGVSSVLQFWDRAGSGGETSTSVPRFELNSVISTPHRGNTTAVAYHGNQHIVATTGLEGDLRIWAQTHRRAAPGATTAPGRHWHCRSVASYRGEPMHAAAFSPDGSLLAAAAGDTITLWDPHTNTLITTLTPALSNRGSPFHSIAFLAKSPCLVAASGSPCPTLAAWNLSTGALSWSSSVCVSTLRPDPIHACFAASLHVPGSSQRDESSARAGAESSSAADGDESSQQAAAGLSGSAKGAVAVFSADSPIPRHLWALPGGVASALAFAPPDSALHAAGAQASPKGMSPLVILTADRQYTIAADANQTPMPAVDTAMTGMDEDTHTTGFQASYGSINAQAAKEAERLHKSVGVQSVFAMQPGAKPAWVDLFDAPSHVLPPLSTLLPAFLDIMVPKNDQTVQ